MKPLLPLLLLSLAPAAFAAPPAQATAASCPEAGEQLTEYLASARQRIRLDGEVRVEFDVDADGRARLVALDGTRSYRTPVRIALQSLDCQRGAPQRYVLNIRFADRAPLLAASPVPAASATVAQAAPAR